LGGGDWRGEQLAAGGVAEVGRDLGREGGREGWFEKKKGREGGKEGWTYLGSDLVEPGTDFLGAIKLLEEIKAALGWEGGREEGRASLVRMWENTIASSTPPSLPPSLPSSLPPSLLTCIATDGGTGPARRGLALQEAKDDVDRADLAWRGREGGREEGGWV